MGTHYFIAVQIIALRTLRQFWRRHPRAETPIRDWYVRVAKAVWQGPADVKAKFGTMVNFV